jgi:predicted MPP superfamily phosphohydrolase
MKFMAVPKLLSGASPLRRRPRIRSTPARRKPPLPLRPIHQMWRKTIDQITLERINLPVRGLPTGLSGVVACQISDLHVDRDEDLARLEHAIDTINGQQPDLIFLTGDYFSTPETRNHYLVPFRRALARLKSSAGVFAIPGNHDHWGAFDRIHDAMRAAGVDSLSNESRRVSIRGEALTIVGIDDLWARRAEPSRAFAGVHPGDCTIVLAHNPDTALYARHLRPGVMLSGHTHGGVVRIPLYGSPIKSILRIGKRFYAGLNRYEDFYIYTNRGLGTYWLRVRINCRPEISRHQLVPLTEAEINRPSRKGRLRSLRPRR